MLEELKERVCKANIQLRDSGLVILTWGNVSGIDRKTNLVVIKPSGVSYDELTPDKMVVVNLDGRVVEGEYRPSSDTPTHIALYKAFDEIGGVVHTHSRFATIWAQAGLDIIAYGTTHADYFYGDVPCTMPLEEEMITTNYELNTGYAIVDTFARRNLGCMEVQACLVAQHGPFTWGETPEKAVENAVVLEEIAHMAVYNTNFQFGRTRISDALLDKHYLRKHGENAYYGQTFGSVQVLDPNAVTDKVPEEDIQITPSAHTVELTNMSQIAEVERPIIVRPPKKEEEVFKFDDKIAPDAENDMSDSMDMGMDSMGLDAGSMDIMPLEPDTAGEDLLPLEPEIELVEITPPPPKPEEPSPRPFFAPPRPSAPAPQPAPAQPSPFGTAPARPAAPAQTSPFGTAPARPAAPPASPVSPAAPARPAAPAQTSPFGTAPARPAAPSQPSPFGAAPARPASPSQPSPFGAAPASAPAAPEPPKKPSPPPDPLDFTF